MERFPRRHHQPTAIIKTDASVHLDAVACDRDSSAGWFGAALAALRNAPQGPGLRLRNNRRVDGRVSVAVFRPDVSDGRQRDTAEADFLQAGRALREARA